MKKYIILILLFTHNLLGQTSIIDSAYKASSNELMINLLNRWSDQSVPITTERLRKTIDIIKYTYDIYEDFYNPKDLKRMANSQLIDSIYRNTKYVLLQDRISVSVYDTLLYSFKSNEDQYMYPNYTIEITDFHPRIIIPNIKIIYLDQLQKCAYGYFLINEYIPIGTRNYFWQQKPFTKDCEDKLKFLNRFINIFYLQNLHEWIIETPPNNISVRYNKYFTKAEVNYELFSKVGTAYYERDGNNWRFIKSNITGELIIID